MRQPRLLCEDCEWTGSQEDCIKNYTVYGETELHCPKCGSVNLIELKDYKSRLLTPVGV